MARQRSHIGKLGTTAILALDEKGYGIGEFKGRKIHIPGALPGEYVRFQIAHLRRHKLCGQLLDIYQPSPSRISPRCKHFYHCGGCALQTLSTKEQVSLKQARLLRELRAQGIDPPLPSPPLMGASWGYRRSARLGVRLVPDKGGALVGFSEKLSNKIAVLNGCETLLPSVARLIPGLRELIGGISCASKIPQIDVIADDIRVVLTLRHLAPLNSLDQEALRAFGKRHAVQWLLQSGGVQTVRTLDDPTEEPLSFSHPFFGVTIEFASTDFVQVNATLNELLVRQVVDWLDLGAEDRVLDTFCGIGNFTLAMARRAKWVTGLEGEHTLVARGMRNATRNHLKNVAFYGVDLYDPEKISLWLNNNWNALLVDPPRSGALELVQQLHAPYPERLVYVSCNPTTFARDAAELVQRHGFELIRLGIADMFPQTRHVESIGLFVH